MNTSVETIKIIIEVLLLVGLSAIFSGLNIALLSLNPADLERKAKLGNPQAIRVLPLRKNSHLALAAILLGNVAAISATSLVLDEKMNGLIAGLLGTLLIVIFGEMLPQALFSKHALSVCSRFSNLLKLTIITTYPVSKPLQLLLDKLLGPHQKTLESRQELGLMISEHLGNTGSELDEDEVEIVKGALQLSEKRVSEIMCPINEAYWLTPDTIIDADKIDEIKALGWSRIPIFNPRLSKCYGVLIMKDLVDINFDKHPVMISQLPLHTTKMVGSKTALDTMFRKFISAKSHLIPVERDDIIVGVVTIEDLFEEILGHEIQDEYDHRLKRA